MNFSKITSVMASRAIYGDSGSGTGPVALMTNYVTTDATWRILVCSRNER